MFTRVPAPSRLPCITAPDTDENGLGMEARAVLVRGRNHIALSWLLLMTPCSFVSRGTPLHLSRTSQTLHNLDRCPREVLCSLSHPQESTESSICRQPTMYRPPTHTSPMQREHASSFSRLICGFQTLIKSVFTDIGVCPCRGHDAVVLVLRFGHMWVEVGI